jgi:hypothetical protein
MADKTVRRRVGVDTRDGFRTTAYGNFNIITSRWYHNYPGWITKVAANVGGTESPIEGQLVIYGAGNDIRFRGPKETWDTGAKWRSAVLGEPMPRPHDRYTRMGFWTTTSSFVVTTSSKPRQTFLVVVRIAENMRYRPTSNTSRTRAP